MNNANPLLDFSDLPLFDRIRPEHVAPAIATLLAEAEAALDTVTQPGFPAEWSAMSRTLDVATERLGRAWGVVSHLNGPPTTPPCPKSPSSTPAWAPTSACTPSTSPWTRPR